MVRQILIPFLLLLILVISEVASSQTKPDETMRLGDTKPCTFGPWDPTIPVKPGRDFYHIAAVKPGVGPFIATLPEGSGYVVKLSGPTSGKIPAARVTIGFRTDKGLTVVCDTGSFDPKLLDVFHQLVLPAYTHGNWVITIEQTVDKTRLYRLQDFISLEIAGDGSERTTFVPADPVWRSASDDSPHPLVSDCARRGLPLREDIDQLAEQSIPANALKVPLLLHAGGGSHLFLKIKGTGHLPVKISISAANRSAVCSTMWHPEESGSDLVVAAELPGYASGMEQWLISLEAQSSEPLTITSYLETGAADQASNTSSWLGILECIKDPNPGRVRTFSPPVAAMSNFTAYALTMDFSSRSAPLDSQALASTRQSLLTAIALWRRMCQHCSPYYYSTVSIDSEVYVLDALMNGQPGAYTATLRRQTSREGMPSSLLGGYKVGTRTPLETYSRLELDTAQQQLFCGQPPDGVLFDPASSPLCRPSPAPSEQERIVHVRVKYEGLNCDPSPNTVACFNGGSLIELNGRDYTFYVGDINNSVFGTGGQRVDLTRVFIHEAGHWLGLPHIASNYGIMSDTFGKAQCIDDSVFQTLNSIATGKLPPAGNRPHALHFK